MMRSAEALEKLKRGNARFVAGKRKGGHVDESALRNELVAGQAPSAILLGCSDSRVPAELVFDQSLGDLFVIRVAGNIVARSQIGSVEFAAKEFGTRLVVVMGHTQCGAINATLDELQQLTENRSPFLQAIVEHIQPAVEPLLATALKDDRDALVAEAVRANVKASVAKLTDGSDILRGLIDNDGLVIVGAEYSLETGEVEFFDTVE